MGMRRNLLIIILVTCSGVALARKIRYDEKHLKMDFSSLIGNVLEILSGSEMDFRYFAAHDYDENKKLDGLELMKAMMHEESHEEPETSPQHTVSLLADVERDIDEIFGTYDANFDGFLDYKEFVKAQRGKAEASSNAGASAEL